MRKLVWQERLSLPKHAPLNARYGAQTGWRSTLGGLIYRWADEEGRDLGESNGVPANLVGERTTPGRYVEPGIVIVIFSTALLRKLREARASMAIYREKMFHVW